MGRPLPSIAGVTLDGRNVSSDSLRGKRLIVVFFDPEAPEAKPVLQAIGQTASQRSSHNFEILGVATGSSAEGARRFMREGGLDFPVIDHSDPATATRQRRLRVLVMATDADGIITGGWTRFPSNGPDAASAFEEQLRKQLRLPARSAEAPATALERPPAPLFTAPRLAGGAPFELSSLRGRPLVLIFFLHNCSHCQAALRTLKAELAAIPQARRPTLIGVEVSGRTSAIPAVLQREGLDFFPVLLDPERSVRDLYQVFGDVPLTVLIDGEGRILYRSQPGWEPQRDPVILKTWLAKLAGLPVPMLLDAKGYTGNEVCGACHELEHATWRLTRHASAFDTLVTHSAERDPACVGCHVTGFGMPEGYAIPTEVSRARSDLEDVGCEACHGRGGPHLSPDFVTAGDYAPRCLSCHDAKHSLGFAYETFRPKISHAALAALPEAERKALAAGRRTPRDVLPTGVDFVGSDACRDCHAAEFEIWSKSRHALSLASLARGGKQEDAACLRCHTTGFGRPGGFPAEAKPGAHPDLARVGCESCHGPGATHVAAGSAKRGSILALEDKCESCAIFLICGTCHDEANDPGFEFEVKQKIEAQRHGAPAATPAAAQAGPP